MCGPGSNGKDPQHKLIFTSFSWYIMEVKNCLQTTNWKLLDFLGSSWNAEYSSRTGEGLEESREANRLIRRCLYSTTALNPFLFAFCFKGFSVLFVQNVLPPKLLLCAVKEVLLHVVSLFPKKLLNILKGAPT